MPDLLYCSAILPTYNRPVALRKMLDSLADQSAQPIEMIVVDASTDNATELLCKSQIPNLITKIVYYRAIDVGAARQRNQAIAYASQPTILLLDDDITFEPDCLMRLWAALQSDPALGGVNAMIINQQYSAPGPVSHFLFRFLHGREEDSYAGLCIGPGLNLLPEDRPDLPETVSVEWLNAGCTLYRRTILPQPPFPSHFHGASILEDLALSLVVGKHWKLANARTARIYHDSQSGDHKRNIAELSRMELVNRHYVMKHILQRHKINDYWKLCVWELFVLITSARSLHSGLHLPAIIRGKWRGIREILSSN